MDILLVTLIFVFGLVALALLSLPIIFEFYELRREERETAQLLAAISRFTEAMAACSHKSEVVSDADSGEREE